MPTFINDHFVSDEAALLHVSDLSIQRGYGVFDFLRSVNGVPLFAQDHLDRFYNSAKAMHLPMRKTRDELREIINELIKSTGTPETGIRITLTGGNSPDSYHLASPNLIITSNPVRTATEKNFEKGYSVITHAYQRELPHVKSINYLMAIWLQPLLEEMKADDMLYFNKESITEFPRCNVFVVTQNGILATPVNNILQGITRKQVLLLAKDSMEVEERNIPVDELLNAKEIFLTATTKKIIPVLKLNNTPIGDGKPGIITTNLYRKFLELEKSLTHLVNL